MWASFMRGPKALTLPPQILPDDVQQRREVVESGCLKTIQAVDPESDPTIQELIEKIKDQYPPEVIEYTSPNFTETLAAKIKTEGESK